MPTTYYTDRITCVIECVGQEPTFQEIACSRVEYTEGGSTLRTGADGVQTRVLRKSRTEVYLDDTSVHLPVGTISISFTDQNGQNVELPVV